MITPEIEAIRVKLYPEVERLFEQLNSMIAKAQIPRDELTTGRCPLTVVAQAQTVLRVAFANRVK